MPRSAAVVVVAMLLLSLALVRSHEICRDFSAPTAATNSFCTQYSGDTCCAAADETTLNTNLTNLAISDTTCEAFFKQILCAQCDPWGAHLFESESGGTANTLSGGDLAVPNLCGSYCTSFYSACSTINIPGIGGAGKDTIASAYASSTEFCDVFAPAAASVCFDGNKYTPPPLATSLPSNPVVCVEKFRSGFGGVYIQQMLDPNDSTNRLFVALKNGSIFVIDKNTGAYQATLLTRTDLVGNGAGGETGLLGMVLHPDWNSGTKKFYINWSCPKATCPVSCSGTCAISKLGCTSSFCDGDHTSVISEYTISAGDQNTADTSTERKILQVPQPYSNHNSGLLLFGPSDKKLYVFWGDGGSANDPENRGPDKTTVLGKVLRIDINSKDLGLEYSIPSDNPFFSATDGTRKEIWATGMRNPWRGSFDADNSAYLYVGDVGQDAWEEVDLITKGGFFGWPVYEGNHTKKSLMVSDLPVWLITDDSHTSVGGGPAVVGGYVYRGSADTCITGKYLYGDYQGNWFALLKENPPLSGKYEKTRIQFRCANNSPSCGVTGTSTVGTFASFAEDAEKNVYILANSNILRVVSRARCSLSTSDCAATPVPPATTTASPTNPPGGGTTQSSTTTPSSTTTLTTPLSSTSTPSTTTTNPPTTSPGGSTTTPSSTQPGGTTTPPSSSSAGVVLTRLVSFGSLVGIIATVIFLSYLMF